MNDSGRAWRSTQAGRRDTPGKGAGRESGARVQIPPSPLSFGKPFWKSCKKYLTNELHRSKIIKSPERGRWMKIPKGNKKSLTKKLPSDILMKLSLKRTENIDN